MDYGLSVVLSAGLVGAVIMNLQPKKPGTAQGIRIEACLKPPRSVLAPIRVLLGIHCPCCRSRNSVHVEYRLEPSTTVSLPLCENCRIRSAAGDRAGVSQRTRQPHPGGTAESGTGKLSRGTGPRNTMDGRETKGIRMLVLKRKSGESVELFRFGQKIGSIRRDHDALVFDGFDGYRILRSELNPFGNEDLAAGEAQRTSQERQTA